MRLEQLKENEVFHYEGSTYVKSSHEGKECFMIVGFLKNNRSGEITLESEVDRTGMSMSAYLSGNRKASR